MQFTYLNTIPAAPDQAWFAVAYRNLRARLEAIDPAAAGADWLDLIAHWNEVKVVAASERARVDWDESLDAGDAEAAARAKRFHSEIRPVVTEQDAQLRGAIQRSPAAVEAARERYGGFLIDQWECAEIAAHPINISVDVAERDLSSRYHALRGTAQVDFQGQKHTLTSLEKFGEHNDERVRREAFEALVGWYRQNREELNSIYLQLVALRDQAGRNLGLANFVPLGYKRMKRLDYGPDETAQFRAQVLAHVTPLVRELRAEQAHQLNTDGVRPWNRSFLPQYSLPEEAAPIGRQTAGVLEIYGRLHPRLAAHFQRMLDRGLIDLENRPCKRGGAFCTSMPDRDEVRIFCNSTGAASDVKTLLHESGHAFQSWESQWIEAIELRSPTLEAAEIHSMGMEVLAFPHLAVFFDAEQARRFKEGHLVKAMQFLCYACVVDGFQHEVYVNPSLTAEELAATWSALWDQYMAGENWQDYRADMASFWHHKLHIFTRPFYYIDYALAQIAALQLWRLAERDPADALERYLELCRLGGTRSFSELVAQAGLQDPFAEETLLDVVAEVRTALAMS